MFVGERGLVGDEETAGRLLELAGSARRNAYARYSRFLVGAAVLTDDNRMFSGCNVENASFGLTVCAERNAIFTAIAQGYRRFRAIAILAGPSDIDADPLTLRPVPPCGACRQVMTEFMQDDAVVWLGRERYLLRDLVPQPFRIPR